MNSVDPVVKVLAGLDQPANPTVEFKDALLARILAELRPAAEPRSREGRPRRVHVLPGVPWRHGGRRRPIALAAAVLIVVVVTASAFGTVRGLFGNDPPSRLSVTGIDGKRGSFTIRFLFTDQMRSWRIVPDNTPSPTGQYVHVSGRGRILRLGGHAEAWHAGLVGLVSRPGEAKQRVVITMNGRPKGPFVLTPLQPGFLKRDSGTQTYGFATG